VLTRYTSIQIHHYIGRHKTDPDKSLVINVEYNQLDPLLRTQGEGDVADPDTGYSPFPGNANNLVIELGAYSKTLQGEDEGVVIEFVNPKYKDDTRTEFKKATRLECMMQDIPKLFQKELKQDAKIGFTSFDRWYTFSPAKNSLESGQDAVKAGNNAPGTLSSAESDLYIQYQRKLSQAGAAMPAEEMVSVAGIPVTAGPRVILSPSFAITQSELRTKIGKVTLSTRSSLVLDGRNIVLKDLDLDGALVIQVRNKDAHLVVDGLSVRNEGWKLADCDASAPEAVRIRGYTMEKLATKEYIIENAGNYLIDASGNLKSL
jgi:UDP-sugar pyrophosphorylase